jgi:hypothetical protein
MSGVAGSNNNGKVPTKIKLLLIGLALATLLVASLNFIHYTDTSQLKYEIRRLEHELDQSKRLLAQSSSKRKGGRYTPDYQHKADSINTFWWPSFDSGLLAKISALQNPADCSSPNTKFFVWRSIAKERDDHRGLTAYGHTGMWQLMHG